MGDTNMVLKKETILNELALLPDSIESDDLMERIYFLSKVEKGLQDIENGSTVSQGDVEERLSQWL